MIGVAPPSAGVMAKSSFIQYPIKMKPMLLQWGGCHLLSWQL